ncbi:Vacuolar protein sorting-associated protein 45 [Trichinella pseudospiralis]|uniref:Vacuolar protein sorting-associated protein 45 n=1 Tax=Trichinella pseudospiralis TaxID=6337 RepID=A0A0V1JYI8_TRIPS|nr:Vacuolar protein sorting-associated protein 45 [Trichinella pseudospiralis]
MFRARWSPGNASGLHRQRTNSSNPFVKAVRLEEANFVFQHFPNILLFCSISKDNMSISINKANNASNSNQKENNSEKLLGCLEPGDEQFEQKPVDLLRQELDSSASALDAIRRHLLTSLKSIDWAMLASTPLENVNNNDGTTKSKNHVHFDDNVINVDLEYSFDGTIESTTSSVGEEQSLSQEWISAECLLAERFDNELDLLTRLHLAFSHALSRPELKQAGALIRSCRWLMAEFCEPQTSKLPNRMTTAVELRDHLNTLSSGFLTTISKGCWSKGAGFSQDKLKPNSETTLATKLPAVQCKQAEEAMNRLLRGEILGGRESDEEEPCENACSFFRNQLNSIGYCVAAMCEAWSAIEACLCPDDLKDLFELIRDLRNLYLYYNTLAEQITHNQRVEMTCELRCNFFHRFSEELTWPAQRCWNKLLELLPVDVGEQLTSGIFSEFEKKIIKVSSDVGSFTETKNIILPLLRYVEAPNRLELFSRAKRLLQLVDERKSRLLSEICFLSTAHANGSSEPIYLEPNPLESLQRVGTNLQHVLRLCCGSSISSERIKLAAESSIDGLLEIFATKSGLDVEQLANWHQLPIRLAFIRGTVLCLHQWIADEARSLLKDLPRSNSQATYESLCLAPTRCFFASAIFGHVTKLMAAVISVKFGFPYNLITDSEDKNNEIYYLKKIVAEQKQILAMKEAQRSDLEKQLKKLKDLNEKNIETVLNAATELVKANTKNYECKLKTLKIEHEQAFIEERTATSRAIEVLKQQFDAQLKERLRRCRVDSSETETNNIQTKEFINLLDHFAKLSLEYNKILIEKTALEQQLHSCGLQKIKTNNSSNNGINGIQLELIKEDCDEQMERFNEAKSKNNATKKSTISMESIRMYIAEMIRITGPGMKVLVMDKETTGIVSCAYAQSEVMQKEVYLFERIDTTVPRDPIKYLKCIAFVRPTPENIELLVRELQNPSYNQYYFYFSNVISKSEVKQLAEADEFEVVREVQEFYADFVALGSHLFSLNLFPAYHCLDWSPNALKRTIQGISSVILSLKKPVTIRYQASSDMTKKLADNLKSLMAKESALFNIAGSSDHCALLLILDRRFDAITPLLNQASFIELFLWSNGKFCLFWTYQAMVHELFGIKNNRVSMEGVSGVRPEMRELLLNPLQDAFYAKNMYSNFGEIGQRIKEMMDEFQKKAQTHQKLESIADLKAFVEQYPQFKKMSGAVAKHVTLVSELSRLVSEYNLLEISELEQHLACHEEHTNSLKNVRRMLNHEKTSDLDATRLVMLYALRFESHPNNDIRGLVNQLRKRGLPEKYYHAIYDVVEFGGAKMCGIETSSELDPIRITKKLIKDLKGVENIYTQHRPLLSEILNELSKNRLKESVFPYSSGCSPLTRVHEVIVFIAGGVTYEESLAVNTFNQAGLMKVILGGTTVHSGRSFIDEVINATQGVIRSGAGSSKLHL